MMCYYLNVHFRGQRVNKCWFLKTCVCAQKDELDGLWLMLFRLRVRFCETASVISLFVVIVNWAESRNQVCNLKLETPRKSLCFGPESAETERSLAKGRKEGRQQHQQQRRFILKAGGNYWGKKIVSVERPGLYDTARKNKHVLNKTLVHKNI